jgi:peptidoglycan hydrolase-like protein with peptidoglycan-binding domain
VSETDPGPTVAASIDLLGALPAGARLRGYEILAILGHGGFGVTYRARDTTLGRDVAIKEYLPASLAVREGGRTVVPRSTELAEDFKWGRERFLDEARTLAKLDRVPGIVRVHDFLEANGTAYMVMALAQGETLERRIKGHGVLSPDAVRRLVYPLLNGLEEAHAEGFLHRDIKPANIVVDGAGLPTLIDFGAARAAMAGRSTTLTAIFTPGFAAVEQMTSAEQGPWTDVYGLAATLYCAISGRTPPAAFDRMLNDTYQPLAKLKPPGFAPDLLDAVDKGLALLAKNRPQSIAEWRGMFRQPAIPTAPPPTAAAGPRRGPILWIGLAAAAAVMVAGGGYYLATSRSTAPSPALTPAVDTAAAGQDKAAQDKAAQEKAAQEAAAAEQTRRQEQAELARLRSEMAAREKAEQEAAARRQIEEETRRKVEADAADKKRLEDEARQKAEADAAARRNADDDARKAAEAAEAALRLGLVDRQHVQIALTALGFNVGNADGAFGSRTRDMIAAWQKAQNYPSTGFLTGSEYQALLTKASAAVAKFDDDQRKLEEEKKKADDAKRAAAAAPPAPAAPPVSPGPVVPEERRITLPKNSAPSACVATVTYTTRISPNKFQIRFQGDNWASFDANATGAFGGPFQNPATGHNFYISGNLRTRVVSVDTLPGPGCRWKGSY